ncbi:hypothetical protein EV360DRAFT_84450 [Lentinula raphanica]|nr:hypothetical protein EV360DRAFT_84450 [Lentinula raphanica]
MAPSFRPIAPNPNPVLSGPAPIISLTTVPPASEVSSTVSEPPSGEPLTVIELPVYFVAVKQHGNGVALPSSACLNRQTWTRDTMLPSQLDVGFRIGINVQDHHARKYADGSIRIDRGGALTRNGVSIGKFRAHLGKTEALDRMWEELHGTTFTSQADFLRKTEEKLEGVGQEWKGQDSELGWEQLYSEKANLELMITRVEEMEKRELELELKKLEESKDKRKGREEEGGDREGKKRKV